MLWFDMKEKVKSRVEIFSIMSDVNWQTDLRVV